MAVSSASLLAILNQEKPIDPQILSRLNEASMHEADVAMHARKAFSRSSAGPAAERFVSKVKTLLGWEDKIKLVENLMDWPLSTTAVCDRIADVLTKVFRGEDGYAYALFEDGDDEADFAAYLEQEKEAQFWRKEGFRAGFYAPHTLLIVDLPSVETTSGGLPAPYWYTMDVSTIRGIDFNRNGDLSYVMVQFEENRCGAMDEVNYYTFERVKQGENNLLVWQLDGKGFHGLGEVPARFLWNDAEDSPLVRQGILTALKADLNWLLFWQLSKKLYDLGAPYEILWLLQPTCTYETELKEPCHDGIINRFNSKDGKYYPTKCPACQERKRLGGIGSVLELPIPLDKSMPDLRPPAGRIPADGTSLEYITNEQERLEQVLFRQATSQRPDVSAEAINEKQVGQQMDNEEAVLQYFAEGMSDARTWLWRIVALLRYGPARFRGAATSYGSRFTALDRGAIAKQLEDGISLPIWAKSDLLDKLRTALSQGNSRHKSRLQLLALLEPWEHITLDQARALGLDQTDAPAFALKADFGRRLGWLEAEYGDILLIRADQDPIKRYEYLLELLIGYGQKQLGNATSVPTATGNPGATNDQFNNGNQRRQPETAGAPF